MSRSAALARLRPFPVFALLLGLMVSGCRK